MCLVDVQAAIEENSLEGNLYLLDNLGRDGSQNECTPELVVAANGTHWSDGSQANEVLINWLCNGIGSLPIAVSRAWHLVHTKSADKNAINRLRAVHRTRDNESHEDYKARVGEILDDAGHSVHIRNHEGQLVESGTKLLNIFGEPFNPHADGWDTISHMTPYLENITGEAVDKGVMFPTQEGTPIHIKDGWYWCATIDTRVPGLYEYEMHFILHKLDKHEGLSFWEPMAFKVKSSIRVASLPKVNGFTHAGIGIIPLSLQHITL